MPCRYFAAGGGKGMRLAFFSKNKTCTVPFGCNCSQRALQNRPSYLTSGILQSSPVCLPHTVHSPISFFSTGLLLAQVPLNSLPVMICLRLMRPKEMKNTPKISPKM